MISQDDGWREIINSLDAPDLEESTNPKPEEISDTPKNVNSKDKDQKFMVHKINTEIYVYTDLQNEQYGEMSFQDVTVLGEMSAEKMLRLFKKKRKQQERDSES